MLGSTGRKAELWTAFRYVRLTTPSNGFPFFRAAEAARLTTAHFRMHGEMRVENRFSSTPNTFLDKWQPSAFFVNESRSLMQNGLHFSLVSEYGGQMELVVESSAQLGGHVRQEAFGTVSSASGEGIASKVGSGMATLPVQETHRQSGQGSHRLREPSRRAGELEDGVA